MREFWRIDAKGDYIYTRGSGGLVCPHHDGFFRVSCGKLTAPRHGDFDTILQAFEYVEAVANDVETPLVPRPFVLTEYQETVLGMSEAAGKIGVVFGVDV